MKAPPNSRHPLAEAMDWVTRIMAVALEMVLPGLAGQWLDRWLGTGFLALVGFAFGLTAGVYHLLIMTRSVDRRQKSQGEQDDTSQREQRQ